MGKYDSTADLMLDWFGFDQTSKYVYNSTLANQLNQNKETGGQLYSDTCLYKLGEYCHSFVFILLKLNDHPYLRWLGMHEHLASDLIRKNLPIFKPNRTK